MWRTISIIAGIIILYIAYRVISDKRRKKQEEYNIWFRTTQYGKCPECDVPYDTKKRWQQIILERRGDMEIFRDIYPTELYCPNCGTIINHDLYGEIDRWRSTIR